MKPSRELPKDILGVISQKQAEDLLLDLANFAPNGLSDPSVERLFRLHGKVFAEYDLRNDKGRAELYNFVVLQIRDLLRKVWTTPDLRSREWYLYQLRDRYHRNRVEQTDGKRLRPIADKFKGGFKFDNVAQLKVIEEVNAAQAELGQLLNAVPLITPFEAAVFHLQRIAERASYCQNPVCHTPYFLATKLGQRFCSSPCARPAQQEAKRRWWTNHGAEWRTHRRKHDKR